MEIFGSITAVSGSIIATSFTGSHSGDGSGLNNIPASSIEGLNLSQITSGSVSASLNANGFQVNTNAEITGSLRVTGTIISDTSTLVSGSSQISYTGLSNIPSGIISGAAQLPTGIVSGAEQLPSGIISGAAQLPSGTVSGSGQIDITQTSGYTTFSSSISSSIGTIETATSSLNSFTSSLLGAVEITGSNLTVKGDFMVKGTTTIIDSTTLDIRDNIIQLNGAGSANGGLVVRDATAPNNVSGSLLWDTTGDKWIAGPAGTEDDITLLNATQSLSNKTINGTLNTISNIANASLTNSSITIAGNGVSLGGTITATTILSSTGVWSGSAQLPGGVVSGSSQVVSSLPSGTVSGSSQVSYTGLSSIPAGIISGAAQLPSGTVSGSSQVSYTGITDKPTLVSGSSQVSFTGLSNIPVGIISGAAQLPAGTVSGSSQVSYTGLSNIPSTFAPSAHNHSWSNITSGIPSGLVSGSSQVSYTGLSSIPAGIVSGSSQVSYTGLSNIPSTFAPSAHNHSWSNITSGIPSGLVSGSSQVSYTGLSSIPAGIVSGSSQIAIGSTSGFGSYINQAVLTNSSPTFAGLTSTGNIVPSSNNTYNLGSAALGWANVYTNDLHLSNMNKPEGNDIDQTKGDWTIQEGEENLYIINNITGKKYKINLIEI